MIKLTEVTEDNWLKIPTLSVKDNQKNYVARACPEAWVKVPRGVVADEPDSKKRVIIVSMGFMDVVMFNPEILKESGTYEAEEGCLSLTGIRKTTRYQKITVKYQDMNFQSHTQEYSGWIAQIIQHDTYFTWRGTSLSEIACTSSAITWTG